MLGLRWYLFVEHSLIGLTCFRLMKKALTALFIMPKGLLLVMRIVYAGIRTNSIGLSADKKML